METLISFFNGLTAGDVGLLWSAHTIIYYLIDRASRKAHAEEIRALKYSRDFFKNNSKFL